MSDKEQVKREDVLNYLLTVLFKKILLIEEKTLKKDEFSDLTMTLIHAIEAIGQEKEPRMNQVASRLGITQGTLSTSVENLVQKGYVERTKSDDDRRAIVLRLSNKGRRAYEHHFNFHNDMVRYALASLDTQEEEILIKTISKIIDYFEQKYKLNTQ